MKHIEVVAAILINEDKVLCLQRNTNKYEYLSYKFEFPGGKLEQDETKEDALHRELMEELALPVEIDREFMTVNHQYPDFRITLFSYICRPLKSEFVLNEHISFKWLEKYELDSLDWAEADLPIVEMLSK